MRASLMSALLLGLCAVAHAEEKAKPAEAPKADDADKGFKVVPQKATKARGDAPDENIKSKSEKNDPSSKVAPPPDKGGAKTRGGACGLHVDNRTRWIIKIFVDGHYRGAVGPYGDVGGVVGSGWPTTLYARADFEDGTVMKWGPKMFNCESSETYKWRVGD